MQARLSGAPINRGCTECQVYFDKPNKKILSSDLMLVIHIVCFAYYNMNSKKWHADLREI